MTDHHPDPAASSLRDRFAGQALAGLCANPNVFAHRADCGWGLCNCTEEQLAFLCYQLADTMLAMRGAREVKP